MITYGYWIWEARKEIYGHYSKDKCANEEITVWLNSVWEFITSFITLWSFQKPIANISQKITRNLFYNIKILKHWLNASPIKNKWKTSLDETLLGCRQMGNRCNCSLGLTLQQWATWQSVSGSLVWQYGGIQIWKLSGFFYIFDKLILLERGPSLERLSLHRGGAFIIQWAGSPLNNCIYHGRHRRFLRKFFGTSWEILPKELMSMTSQQLLQCNIPVADPGFPEGAPTPKRDAN